jgi:hypothetical protein
MTVTRWLVMIGLLWPVAGSLSAAPPRIAGLKAVPRVLLPLEKDFIAPLGAADSVLASGVLLDVWLLSGKRYEQLELASLQRAKEADRFRGLNFQPMKGQPSKLSANTLYQLRVGERVLEIVADPESKAFVALDLSLRNEQARERLAAQQERLWATDPSDAGEKADRFHAELFSRTQTLFPNLPLTRTETKYFVVYTDMPAQQVGGYVANLDSMYAQLCTLFGVPPDTNIWQGKCPVFAFREKAAFLEFEARLMNNPSAETAAGLNHAYSDGKVVIACVRGDDPVFFAAVLVHETAHGFVHRMRSSVRVPLWLNEGLSEWVSAVVVPQSPHVANRMQEALPRLRGTGRLGDNFFGDEGPLERWQYGVAATLVQFLLSSDANAFRALVTAIKEGQRWERALELTYGLTPVELGAAYGRTLGIPGLVP